MGKLFKFLIKLIPFKKTLFLLFLILFVVPLLIPKQTVFGVQLIDVQKIVVAKGKEFFLKALSDGTVGDVNVETLLSLVNQGENGKKEVSKNSTEATVSDNLPKKNVEISGVANKLGINESELLQQIYNKKEEIKLKMGTAPGLTGTPSSEAKAGTLIFGNAAKSKSNLNTESAASRFLSLTPAGQKISDSLKSKGDNVQIKESAGNTHLNSSEIPSLKISNDEYRKIDLFLFEGKDVWMLLKENLSEDRVAALIGVSNFALKDYLNYHNFLYSDIRLSLKKYDSTPQDFLTLMKKNNWRVIDVKRATGWDDLQLLNYIIRT